ncbi:MAG: aminotransferase class IV, partial [Polyangiales bacterium]
TDDRATAGAKVSSYVSSILALRDARACGAQEALFCRVEPRGRSIVEGATSNVLAVVDGRLRAPLAAGVLAGITRSTIVECAKDLDLVVDEAPIDVVDLMRASELMVCSTIREVVPVVEVVDVEGRRRIGEGVVGGVFRALRAALRVRIDAQIQAQSC